MYCMCQSNFLVSQPHVYTLGGLIQCRLFAGLTPSWLEAVAVSAAALGGPSVSSMKLCPWLRTSVYSADTANPMVWQKGSQTVQTFTPDDPRLLLGSAGLRMKFILLLCVSSSFENVIMIFIESVSVSWGHSRDVHRHVFFSLSLPLSSFKTPVKFDILVVRYSALSFSFPMSLSDHHDPMVWMGIVKWKFFFIYIFLSPSEFPKFGCF